jgi:TonB dependent receptor
VNRWRDRLRRQRTRGITVAWDEAVHDYVNDKDSGESYKLDFSYKPNGETMLYALCPQGLPVAITPSSCVTQFFVNSSEAQSRGVELENNFQVTKNLRLDVGGSYTKARLTEDVPNLGAAGNRLPGSPSFTASTGLQVSRTA